MVLSIMRHPALRLLSLSGFLLLSACGFVPLYSQQGLTGNLSQIALDVPQTRTGYFVEQDLKNGLGIDPSHEALYSLKIEMTERHYSIGFRVNDTSTRSEITNTINYVLMDKKSGQVLLHKSFVDTVTYDTSASPFTGVVSQQDAQVRIATDISQKIQTELALYFREKH